MELVTGIFQPDIDFKIEDVSEGKVNGQSVLARVEGQFFVPDGKSRNRRYYPRSLWEKALSQPYITEKIENKTMYGTIGHTQPLDDNAILEGKVSHIVTKLYIDDTGRGIGEALILDTPAGNVLNTLLRAGSKLYVSSRAKGKFKGTHDGMPIVDENNYHMKTFDFVVDPGFLEAHPDLKESYDNLAEKDDETNIDNEGEKTMSNENNDLIKNLHEQNAKHVTSIEKLNNKIHEQAEELSTMKEEKHNMSADLENFKELEEDFKKLSEELEAYKAYGTAEEIKEAKEKLATVETELKEYKDIDPEHSATDIAETLEAANKLIDEYKAVADTPESITEALKELQEKLDKYGEFGTAEEVAELYILSTRLLENEETRKTEEAVSKLAAKIGVEESKIKKVYDKLTEEEIVELFKGQDEAKKYEEEKKRLSESNEEDVDLEEESSPFGKKSLCQSLLETY